MSYVVVDASVVIAALMKDGSVRRVLLNAPEDAAFCAPPMLVDEVRAAIPEIVVRSKKPHAEVQSLVEAVLQRLILVPIAALAAFHDEAVRLAKEADAHGDEPYVAAALALRAPVWTLDDDFDRIRGIQRLRTRDLARGS